MLGSVSNKKILVLSFYYKPDLCAGSFRCTSLINALKEKGAFIHLVTTTPNRYESFSVDVEQSEIQTNLRVDRIKIPNHKSGMIDQAKAFYVYFRETRKLVAREEYDLVVATSSRLFTAFLAALISNKKSWTLYLDIRDLFVETLSSILPYKLTWLLKPIFLAIEKYTFNSAKKINIVSEGFLSYFMTNYGDIPISSFTNGIDEEFIEVFKTPFCQLNQKKNSKLSVVYAGNIGEGQGLHKIIPVMAQRLSDHANFKVIGAGGRINKLRSMSENLKLNNFELVPPMARYHLIQEYKKADILFLHLNDHDVFKKVLPSKLFEYAATDKPILAGISGYSAQFAKSEIENCSVFTPTDFQDGIDKLKVLELRSTHRVDFKNKYRRSKIMSEMAEDIYGLL